MCRIDVRCTHSSGGGLLVAAGLVVVVGMVLSVLGSVLASVAASVAALVSTLVWALATTAGVGALLWAGVFVTREVLAYRADKRDERWVLAQLAAHGITPRPAGAVLGHSTDRPAVTAPTARPVLVAGRGGAR